MTRAILIPVSSQDGLKQIDLDAGDSLKILQEAVGGRIEALPFPDNEDLTCYVHEEGKFCCLDESGRVQRNLFATVLMHSILAPGDFIAGPMVVCGFDPTTGEHRDFDGSVAA